MGEEEEESCFEEMFQDSAGAGEEKGSEQVKEALVVKRNWAFLKMQNQPLGSVGKGGKKKETLCEKAKSCRIDKIWSRTCGASDKTWYSCFWRIDMEFQKSNVEQT